LRDGRAIIVSGTPGTGKTRFGRLLARKLGIDTINVTRFARQHNFTKSYDRRRRTWLIDDRKLQRELEKHVTSLGKKVLVEGHYSHSLLPTQLVDLVFILRCNPEILRDRLRSRGYPLSKIGENVEAEVLDICVSEAVAAHGLKKVAEIDASNTAIEDCVEEALLILAKKKTGHAGRHDWLAMLEGTGKLDKFLQERTAPWRKRSS